MSQQQKVAGAALASVALAGAFAAAPVSAAPISRFQGAHCSRQEQKQRSVFHDLSPWPLLAQAAETVHQTTPQTFSAPAVGSMQLCRSAPVDVIPNDIGVLVKPGGIRS
jgi:hypothetical protein